MHTFLGPRPIINKGTQAILEFTGKREFSQGHDEWDHRVISEEGKKSLIEVRWLNLFVLHN